MCFVCLFLNSRTMAVGAVLRPFLSGCAPKLSKVPRVSALPLCVRTVHACPVLRAGHNKWSKVKDIKIPKDAARARVIAKYAMLIRVAVRGATQVLAHAPLLFLIITTNTYNL